MSQPPPHRPLDYRSPPGDHEPPTPPFGFAVGAVIGFTLYVGAASVLIGVAWFVAPHVLTFVVGVPLVIAGLAVFTIYSNTRWGWRGLSVGILIGFGLTLLIPGVCFVIVLNS